VRGSIRLSHSIAQLILAVSLITVMTLTGLVVSSAPTRAAFAQGASNVSTAVSREPAHAISAMALAETPGVICGVSGGGCP
jgi:hypothetical protein